MSKNQSAKNFPAALVPANNEEAGNTNPATPGSRPGTKQALICELLRRETGASLEDLIAATGWLPHTTRAALTGLRKRGCTLINEKAERVTRYRLIEGA